MRAASGGTDWKSGWALPCGVAGWLRLLVCALCLTTFGQAQAQSTKVRLERFDFSKVPDIRMYLSVTEEDGTVIAGRQASDFKMLYDGAEQGTGSAITLFEAAKEPIYVMAVVQATTVVSERALTEVKNGLRRVNEVVSAMNGRMGVLSYASTVTRHVESGVTSEVDSAINKIAITEESDSHMLEALRTAIDLLKVQDPQKSPNEQRKRKLIILFSDGIDVNMDKKLFKEVGVRAQQAGIVINPVGYNEIDPKQLRLLSEITKNCYGVDRFAKAPSEVGPKMDAIVEEITKQYVVTFPMAIQGDDKEHTFGVMQEAGGRPQFSNTINEKYPSKPTAAATSAPQKSRLWLWILLGVGLLGAAVVVALLLRKKPKPVAAQPTDAPRPMAAPMPTGGANRTMAIEAAGDIAMGWMMGLTGKYKDKTYKLKDRTVVGTAADCDVVIDDGFMSARHCEIRKVAEGFKLVDLGATNGVVVNDKRVKEHFLVDNDNFRLGRTEFKFKSIFS